MDEVTRILSTFLANPFDPEIQMQMVDMTKRNPLAIPLLLAEGGSHTVLSCLPKYITLRKVNDTLIRYDKKELRLRLKELDEEKDLDTVDEDEEDSEKIPVIAPSKRGRKKTVKTSEDGEEQPVAVGASASVNFDDIFNDDEEG
jgi:hypothetical protein